MKKLFRAVICVALVLALCISTCSTAFAASFGSKEYVKEVILSYGETADAAKKWLTDNGYQVVDNNLNEGADDLISTKRAVYLGYKTTDKADEAITDMKLMNMNGSYSVQDYQKLLDEQKANIQSFFENFKVAVNEYRANYKAGQARAVAAHDMLNMLYDDDTKQNLGDLLLSKVREEYTDKEYAALTDEQKAKVADMTTILMQGNSNAVLSMEQLIATATDESETPWLNRYQSAKTYDEMVEELMDKDDLTVGEAAKELAKAYDQDARKIAANFESYKSYLENYTNSGLTLESTAEEIEAYQEAHEDFNYAEWCALGTQYTALQNLTNDDISLYELMTDADYDVLNEDRCLLYPLVSVLSDGQRACLDFLSTYQLMALGLNDDATVQETVKQVDLTADGSLKNISVYDGVDRALFSQEVALTDDAYKLQVSSGQNAVNTMMDYVSTTTFVLLGSFFVSSVATALAWGYSRHFNKLASDWSSNLTQVNEMKGLSQKSIQLYEKQLESATSEMEKNVVQHRLNLQQEAYEGYVSKSSTATAAYKSASTWANVMFYAKIVTSCITVILMGLTVWSYIQDMREYYNAELTPIPRYMVSQGVDADDKQTFTYYTAAKCNRADQNMVTDSTKLLEDYGDVNGDVGRQWVALYTTKDTAAGDPVTTDFAVQYNNTNLPDDHTALSMFGESSAQNLTNKKAGFTYANSKDGIYLFYGTDSSALAGSVITNGSYVLVGGISAVVGAVLAFFIGKAAGKKKNKKEGALENA